MRSPCSRTIWVGLERFTDVRTCFFLAAPAPTGLALGLASAPGPAGNAPISVLFVLQAANATLTPVTGEARNYTLVASGVAPGVVAFTDTPVR
jgi:hypothetical protein